MVAEWEGELIFLEQRFVVDPFDDAQIMDTETRKTYRSPELAERLREHAQRFGTIAR